MALKFQPGGRFHFLISAESDLPPTPIRLRYFVFSQQRTESLQLSRDAADRALQITLDQYREGTVDFTAVFLFASTLAEQDDALASARGAITLSLVALYRSLGGGWRLPEPETAASGEPTSEPQPEPEPEPEPENQR